MTTATKKSRKAKKPGGVTGVITNTYKATMGFGEKISVAALNSPYLILEAAGVAEEKTSGVKNFNAKVVGSVYSGTNWMAVRSANIAMTPLRVVGKGFSKLTGGKAEGKAPKKAAKKAAPKKAAKKPAAKKAAPKKAKSPVGVKKAPAKKKAPPRVAAKAPTKLAA